MNPPHFKERRRSATSLSLVGVRAAGCCHVDLMMVPCRFQATMETPASPARPHLAEEHRLGNDHSGAGGHE